MFSGSGLNRTLSIAYRPSFSGRGDALWLFISNSPLLGREGDHGLRLGAAGPTVPLAIGGPQNASGGNNPPRAYYSPPAEPPGNSANFLYSSAQMLSDEAILVTGSRNVGPARRDFGVWIQTRLNPGVAPPLYADPIPVFNLPGTAELDAILLEARVLGPTLRDSAPPMTNENPPRDVEEAFDAGGQFRFIVENIFFNAPINTLIANAPPIGENLMLEFYMNPQRGGVETLEDPILVARQRVPSDGHVEVDLPAGVPLFEVLRRPDGTIALGRDGQAFHVGGMNFGVADTEARCVGCHAGHSMVAVPRDPILDQYRLVGSGGRAHRNARPAMRTY